MHSCELRRRHRTCGPLGVELSVYVQDRIHAVLREEQGWDEAVGRFLGREATLVAVSRWVGDSRVYALGDRVAVIRSLEGESAVTTNSLQLACEAMRRLGRYARYTRSPPWEVLFMSRIEASSLESILSSLSFGDRLHVMYRVAAALRELHAVGIAHRDLRTDNVLVDRVGHVALVDFDRAVIGASRTAVLADWFGVFGDGLSPSPYLKLAAVTLLPKTQSIARRVRTGLVGHKEQEQTAGSPDVQLLRRAWHVARCSRASAPGQDLAYYALTYKHVHFQGERPWYLRWDAIRRNVPLKGKHVVDLGTNMGLLPAFALLHGARKATGIDADPRILVAARLVARAFGVTPELVGADLIDGPDWESRAAPADIVFAMSLLRWLPENGRALEFLRTQQELVYEGHDPLPVEIERLRRWGFSETQVLLTTERGRSLVWCRRPLSPTARDVHAREHRRAENLAAQVTQAGS